MSTHHPNLIPEDILKVLCDAYNEGEDGLSGRDVCRRVTGNIQDAKRCRSILWQMREQGKVVNDAQNLYATGQWRIA